MTTNTDKYLTSAPVLILGVMLVLLFTRPLPEANADIALAIVSGLLGFLTRQHVGPKDGSGG